MTATTKGQDEMQKYLSAIIMLIVLCGLAVTGRAKIMDAPDLPGVVAVSPIEFEAIRASVVDPNPSNYTLDVRKFANIGVNEDAPDFAIYTDNMLPSKCGDFREAGLSTWKVSKYRRAYNLEAHPDILGALERYGCIVVKNYEAPPEAPAPEEHG